MTELQLYKYIKEQLNPAEDELGWHDDKLILQISPEDLNDFMVFVGKDNSESPIEITYSIDLVPIFEYLGIKPESIVQKRIL